MKLFQENAHIEIIITAKQIGRNGWINSKLPQTWNSQAAYGLYYYSHFKYCVHTKEVLWENVPPYGIQRPIQLIRSGAGSEHKEYWIWLRAPGVCVVLIVLRCPGMFIGICWLLAWQLDWCCCCAACLPACLPVKSLWTRPEPGEHLSCTTPLVDNVSFVLSVELCVRHPNGGLGTHEKAPGSYDGADLLHHKRNEAAENGQSGGAYSKTRELGKKRG